MYSNLYIYQVLRCICHFLFTYHERLNNNLIFFLLLAARILFLPSYLIISLLPYELYTSCTLLVVLFDHFWLLLILSKSVLEQHTDMG